MTKILLASDDVEFERYLRDVLGSPNGDRRPTPVATRGGSPRT
jgi:hypothetical protein